MGGGGRGRRAQEGPIRPGALSTTKFARGVRARLAAAADPGRAPGMQVYMKSTMPYYGLSSAQVDAICNQGFAEHPFPSCDEWRAAILELWRSARFREERYAAIRLVFFKRHRDCWTPQLMQMLEEMIVSGAWWDYVDALAQVVGDLLRSHPQVMRLLMRAWSTDANLWDRRV